METTSTIARPDRESLPAHSPVPECSSPAAMPRKDRVVGEQLRYRRVSTRMWGDEKFRRLSAPKPNGRSLWLLLVTGPQTSPVPGLFHAGQAALAEELG